MDANDAASYVEDLAGDNANIIFGAKYDETMTDAATITVIATGLEENAAKTTASSNLMSGLKYPNTAATTRPVINSGLVNRTANVTTNSSFGATSTLGQTAAQQRLRQLLHLLELPNQRDRKALFMRRILKFGVLKEYQK